MNNQNENFFKKNIYLSIGIIPVVILILHKYLENILWPLYIIPGYIILVVYMLPIIGVVSLLILSIKSVGSKDFKILFLSIFLIFLLGTPILNNTFKPRGTKIINFDMSIYINFIFELIGKYPSNKNNDKVYEFKSVNNSGTGNGFNMFEQQ